MVRPFALLPVFALLLAHSVPSVADVLCSKPSGAVVRRTTCKKKEHLLDLSQFGAVGPKGDPGPSTVYVTEQLFVDGITNAFLTAPNPIASLALPAGSYLLVAKASPSDGDTQSSPNQFDCQLRLGSVVVDESVIELGKLGTNVFLQAGSLTLAAAVTLPVAATVMLDCANNGASNSSINTAKLVAVQTGSIVTQ